VLFVSVGGWLVVQTNTVSYSSYAEIHVARNFQRTLQNDRELELRNTQEYDIFRNEQIGLLLRSDVLEDALSRCGQLESGVWADREYGPAASVVAFSRSLDVFLLPRTYRIALEISGPNPEILKPALDALLEAFLDAHRKEFFFAQDSRPVILKEALEAVETSISNYRKELRLLAEELNILNFQENSDNPWVTPLANSRIALVEAERNEKNLRLAMELEKEAGDRELTLEMVLLGIGGANNPGFEDLVSPLVEQRTILAGKLMDMGPTHPARAEVENKIAGLDTQIEDLLQRQSEAVQNAQISAHRKAETLVTQLKEEVKELEQAGMAFVTSFQKGLVLTAALEENVARRTQLKNRLSFFELETQSPSYVRIVQSATDVDPEGTSKLMRNLAMLVFLAVIFAFGLPLVIDLGDKRVHTTQDIEAVFGFPPAIWIPEPKKGAQLHLAQDQIRRFALALDRDQSHAQSRLIQFTEVKAGKNSQTVVEDIAQALASYGRKVLVVDGAAPRRAKLAKDCNTVGFLGLLAGKGLEVIHRDGWDFLEYGNPLIEKGQVISGWNDILRNAAEDYDLVLIMADPLLGSPDAEHMASSVDLVVLMVEAETQTRGELKRAGDVLASLHPAAVGTILNNAKIFRGHGYYRELLKENKALPPGS
jgi:Mrp family chromosome partitioning ATPase/uncharacterized protein involved in exopolysaccharide biosynthesis